MKLLAWQRRAAAYAALVLGAAAGGGAASCSSNNSSSSYGDGGGGGDDATSACPYDTQNDRWHCGDCNTACKTGEACSGGTCQAACDQPLAKCPGVTDCVDLTTTLEHCGACENVCLAPAGGGPPPVDAGPDAPDPGVRLATAACIGGACLYTCPAGSTSCDDAGCFDLKKNREHCGSCDTGCGSGFCNKGICCQTGQTICGNTCVSTQTDPNNCGTCGNKCPQFYTCYQGQCF
jgi:hypothetical protein